MSTISAAAARRRIATRPSVRMVPTDPEAFRLAHDAHVGAFNARLAEEPNAQAMPMATVATLLDEGEEKEALLDALRMRPEPVDVVHVLLYNQKGLAPTESLLVDAGLWTHEDVEAAIQMGATDDYPNHMIVETNVPGYGVAVCTISGTYYFQTQRGD
jgi:hypothetical protein